MPNKILINNLESSQEFRLNTYNFKQFSLSTNCKQATNYLLQNKKQKNFFLVTFFQFLVVVFFFVITTATHASIVTGFDADSSNWFYDDGEDGLTYLDIQIRDISPVWIELNGSWQTGKTDEDFALTLWNLTGTYLTDLRLRWEKLDINLNDAPIYSTDLNLQFLTRENNSAIITARNSGPNFHELMIDFAQGMGSGVLLIDFEWLNFNLPTGDFKLLIDFNPNKTNPVPVPPAFWFLFTGLLGLAQLKSRKI
jgi:hypothetical protein